MKPAHAIALMLIPFLTVAGAVAATWSQRVRDVFFFAMVSLAVFAERMDVNFFSEAWYRGTSRGIQVTLLEILADGLVQYVGQPMFVVLADSYDSARRAARKAPAGLRPTPCWGTV